MRNNVVLIAAILVLCPLTACSSGGGSGFTAVSTATATPPPAPSPPVPAPTTFVQANIQPPNTMATYPVTSIAMGGAGSGLPPASAGEGVTSVSIATDGSGSFGKVSVSFPIIGGPQNGTIKTADINLSSSSVSQLSQVVSFLKPIFGPINDDAEGIALNQSAGGQALSSSGFGLWAEAYETDLQGNGAGRLFIFAFGNPTPSIAMPATGSATYNGTTVGAGGAADGKTPNSLTALQGNAQIVANFTTQSVNAKLTNLTTQNLYTNAMGTLPDLSGTAAISGNAYSGAIAGTGLAGSINGHFYGSAAQETAGVWQASGGGNNWVGSFGAK